MGGDEKQRKNEGILRFNCRDKWDSEIQVAEKSGRTETGGQSCRKKMGRILANCRDKWEVQQVWRVKVSHYDMIGFAFSKKAS